MLQILLILLVQSMFDPLAKYYSCYLQKIVQQMEYR
nr:MAG TPA: hypothetical protein [Caudoviricetes sp.]